MSEENKREPIPVSDIFNNSRYIVPIYQRNYAWGNDEINQLIDDINDTITQDDDKYYLGTLIVNRQKNGTFEVIDGQQRLTTLYLIKKYCDNGFDPDACKLLFEAREKYKRTFQLANLSNINKDNINKDNINKDDYYSQEIISGYQCIEDNFKDKTKKLDKEKFKEKLRHTYLFIVQVPENIDLNHYFEIMNTRGEQLEPHEIIKAKILGALENQQDKVIAAKIWDKCSDMNTYIQMKFDNNKDKKSNEPTVRIRLFGTDWNTLTFEDFDGIKNAILGPATNNNTEYRTKLSDSADDFIAKIEKLDKDEELNKFFENNPLSYEKINEILSKEFKNKDKFIKQVNLKNDSSLEDIINFSKIHPNYPQNNKTNKEQEEDIEKERFESIINFPNFLLQVNAIINKPTDKNEEGFLDDKNFLDRMKINYKGTKAKKFIYNLLKYRFLFDKFVLKRDYSKNKNEGEWSLKKIKVNGSNFYYVNTLENNKENQDNIENDEQETNHNKQLKMLQATLRVTYTSPKTMKWITVLLQLVEEMQKLKCEDLIEDLITKLENYCRNAIKPDIDNNNENDAYHKMGRIVFSYLDYILYRDGYKTDINGSNIDIKQYTQDWKCVYRNSIEHFSPQKDGDFSNGSENQEILHSFGNLALITISGNSKFSNMKPEQKICEENIINQSLKLKIMKELTSKNKDKKWTKELVIEHQNEMLEKLKEDIKKLGSK